jgi:hypothetical protein
MKTLTIFTLIIFSALLEVSAQKIQERELSHFDKLKITNEIRVYLTQGETESARIEVSGIELDDVLTTITAKTLEISLRRGVYKDISVEVYLTYRELRDIFVSSSGRASVQSILSGDKVVINAHTGAQIDAQLNMKTMDLIATKGASVRLKGKLSSYEATISSGANLSALELVADSAFVIANTKSIAKVAANKLLDAKVRSGSTLTIEGTPAKKNIKTGIGATILEQ